MTMAASQGRKAHRSASEQTAIWRVAVNHRPKTPVATKAAVMDANQDTSFLAFTGLRVRAGSEPI